MNMIHEKNRRSGPAAANTPLPRHVNCLSCGKGLELDQRERTEKRFTCPICGRETAFDKLREQDKVRVLDAGGHGKANAIADRDIRVGSAWLVGGLALTLVTYLIAADTGGHYVFAWGAILFGGIQMIRGIIRAGTSDRRMSQ